MRPRFPTDEELKTPTLPAFTRQSASGVVLLGLSPKNRYYSKRNITSSLRSILAELSTGWTVRPFVPQGPSLWTYLALGYSKSAGLRRAQRHSTEKRRQARGAAAGNEHYKDCCWDDLTGGDSNHLFRAAIERLDKAYETSPAFKQDVQETTRAVLEKRGSAVSEESLGLGCRYIIEEIACLTIVQEVLKVEEVVFVYHKRWKLMERVLEGVPYGLPKMLGVSFAIVNVGADNTADPLEESADDVQ